MGLFEIKNRFNGSVIFSHEYDSLKLCVEAAVKSRANLSGANLSGANLSYANLSYANLSDANLSYANLSYANLSDANLSRANLSGADLSDANLSGADLSRANLSGADLSDAHLSGADLSGAHLYGAHLYGANLYGAKYGDRVLLEHTPLQLSGTKYHIIIMDTHIKIGCKLHSHDEWTNFSDEQIRQMDSGALEWWTEWRSFVLSLSLGHQQRIAAKKEAS